MMNTLIVYAAPLSDIPAKGSTNNWTPVPNRSDYSAGASGASNLMPASYLVSALRPLSSADIVSSASAKIALGGKSANNYDQDQDAVLTRVITPFSTEPEVPDIGRLVQTNSFLEHARLAGLTLIDGVWYDAEGRRASLTSDAFALNLWTMLCIAALVCVALLIATFIPTGRFGRRQKKGVLEAEKGGGQK